MLSTFLSIQRLPTFTGKPVHFANSHSIQRLPTFTGKPVYVVHLSFLSEMANLHRETRPFCPLSFHSKTTNLNRETRLFCPPFVPFKDGQVAQGNPSLLPTFRSIQRRPTYTGKPVYFAHLSFHSKTAKVHKETRLSCPPLIPFSASQLKRICQIMEIT